MTHGLAGLISRMGMGHFREDVLLGSLSKDLLSAALFALLQQIPAELV